MVRLQIWDTVGFVHCKAGTEKYKSLARSYYRSTAGALIVYDISRRASFLKVKDWLSEARLNGHSNLSYLLIGNKSDLSHDREVTVEEARNLAFNEGLNFIETSAQSSTNVEKAFFELSLGVLQRIRTGQIEIDADGSNGVKVKAVMMAPKTTVNLSTSTIAKQDDKKTSCCE